MDGVRVRGPHSLFFSWGAARRLVFGNILERVNSHPLMYLVQIEFLGSDPVRECLVFRCKETLW